LEDEVWQGEIKVKRLYDYVDASVIGGWQTERGVVEN
jgi:hypothetical protein